MQLDKTTEQELLRILPELRLEGNSFRRYAVRISNDEDQPVRQWALFLPFISMVGLSEKPPQTISDFAWQFQVEYYFGWRQLRFAAVIEIRDGAVWSIGYSLSRDVLLSSHDSPFVGAQSVPAFYERGPMVVTSLDDQGPESHFSEVPGSPLSQRSIRLGYTRGASPELAAHAFQLDLRCYWDLGGCGSVKQVAPLLWQDREDLRRATEARLNSSNPCPDEVLAGRVRTLPDLNVALLESVATRVLETNAEGILSSQRLTDYRLREALRGQPQGPWTNMVERPIQWPGGRMADPVRRDTSPGHLFLYFSGAHFESCRLVPATPSAVAAVKKAPPPPPKSGREDGWSIYW